ncbi:MAG: sensor histidine kinase, partial [Chitinophagaceae bacterium]|nr:sensor histidine kinase [Chitinophagaceae bacterium]
YYPPQEDKETWQRLYLQLSSTFVNVVNEGQVDLDSSLYKASRSLGLSRFSILTEGFGDPALLKQSEWIDRKDPATGLRLLSQASGRNRIQLLLLMGSYYAFQRNSYRHYRDSVEYFLQQAISESNRLKEPRLGREALCLLGKMYLQVAEPLGDSIYARLIRQCRVANDRETEAKALAYRSRYTPPTGLTILNKLNDTRAAAAIYHSLGNTEGEINALTDAGYLLTATGQLEPARETFAVAYRLADSIRFPYIHYNAQTLSMVNTFLGKFGEPLRYTLEMIKISENCRDSIGWGYFHSNLALMLASEGRDQEAIAVTDKAIAYFLSQKNPTVYVQLVGVIVRMAQSGRSKEALEMTKNISKQVIQPETLADQFAFHYAFAYAYLYNNQLKMVEWHLAKMDSVESLAEAVRPPFRRTDIDELTGFLLMRKGEYGKARKILDDHLLAPRTRLRPLIADLEIYRTLLEIDSTLGDDKAAVAHYKKYVAVLDSNFKVAKIRQAEELQVLYQIQEKENQISTLTQQAALEKERSARAALLRNITIAGIIAAMIIAVLLYRQNRLKQKSNKMISRKNEQLQDLVDDKEWLLKEIHHRVKNNLQIVISLLNSQSIYIDNRDARTAINDSQRRMQAMALIHQKLYLSDNMSSIAMQDYINELVNYVQESFDTRNRIVFEQDIEQLNLDVSQAIPLGLIINECIVNVMKYAFPDNRGGVVRLTLHRDKDDQLALQIADNGVGLPAGMDISRHNSLGFDLMRGLAKQLNGVLTYESNKGLHIMLRFREANIERMEKSTEKEATAI